MSQLTDYGKLVKKKLIDLGETQKWLQDKVSEKTGLYVDSGYFSKIFAGEREAQKVKQAINEILQIEEART